ncbi:hypothetical protein Psuf_051900 [Phytohabitans suffuscus]|uniref:Uncharacterized protein n=1 Tax=Phytohabitans suffuscus TaxID=624315 RepID=A0A6F8YP12_9ACTN|nr:hypothetical protein Psuf_051900 [Phytohabitans suffuscus]
MPPCHLAHSNQRGSDIRAWINTPVHRRHHSDRVARWQADPHRRRVSRAEERKRRGSTFTRTDPD